MRKLVVGIVTAGALALTGMASSAPAEARDGIGAAVAGGLIAGAVVGGVASSGYGPGYGYYDGYDSYAAAPGYYDAPSYAYGPGYGNGYGYGRREQSQRGGQPDYRR